MELEGAVPARHQRQARNWRQIHQTKTRRCRGSAFICTDEMDPYFPTLAENLPKRIHFERDPKFSDPNHLRGTSPNCIDCIDPTWNRLAARMWETHISETNCTIHGVQFRILCSTGSLKKSTPETNMAP